jgi:hypothetical protein
MGSGTARRSRKSKFKIPDSRESLFSARRFDKLVLRFDVEAASLARQMAAQSRLYIKLHHCPFFA